MTNAVVIALVGVGITVAVATFLFVFMRDANRLRAEAMRLSIEREYAEKRIYEMMHRLENTEDRFKEMNRLWIESQQVALPKTDATAGLAIAKSSKFIRSLIPNVDDLSIYNRKVFFITPFSEIFHEHHRAVDDVCRAKKLILARSDDEKADGSLLQHIVKEIVESNLVIANVSGRNANVFYELAIAQMLEKRVVIIAHIDDDLSFDIAGQQLVTFSDADELRAALPAAIDRVFIGESN